MPNLTLITHKMTLFPLLIFITALTACNNSRLQRLSARGYCEEGKNTVELAINERETELLQPTELPDNTSLRAIDFRSTVILEDQNEHKITLSFSGKGLSQNSSNVAVSCSAGIQPDSKIDDASFSIPVANKDGAFETIQVNVSVGNPTRDDQSDFLTITSTRVPAVAPDSDEVSPPLPFRSFYSEGTQFRVFTAIKPKKDNLPTYSFHHESNTRTNNVVKVTSRISLQEVPEEEAE